MYFCICNGVTNEKVKSLLKKGKTVKQVQSETKIGTNCGICLSKLWEVASEVKDEQRKSK